MMENYDWPGNIRELEHFIENNMVRPMTMIDFGSSNIPSYILDAMVSNNINIKLKEANESLEEILGKIENKIIVKSLDKNKWNVTRTANELGVTRQSLIYRMRKLNINRD